MDFTQIINKIYSLYDSFIIYTRQVDSLYFLIVTGVSLLVLIIVFIYYRTNVNKLKKQIDILNQMISNMNPLYTLEKSLNGILSIISPMILSQGYAFYILDPKSNSYVMKAIRFIRDEESVIEPSYSGLLPFKKESYVPPLSIDPKAIPERSSITKDGIIPLISIPIKGRKGLIRIGPIARIPRSFRKSMEYLSTRLEPFLDMIISSENMKGQVEVVVASNKATMNISHMLLDYDGVIGMIVSTSMKISKASWGFYLSGRTEQNVVNSIEGIDEDVMHILRTDAGIHGTLNNIIRNNEYLIIKKGDKNYFSLPAYFITAGIELLFLAKVNTEVSEGIIGFSFSNNNALDKTGEYRITALTNMAIKIGDILSSHLKLKELSGSYIEMLKTLAQMVDNSNPYSVGYSELMYRYSYIIAKEMNLSQKEVNEITLAAFLSNIGVLGLSVDMLVKEGQYTEIEYELMKLHSEVGASIIETTFANNNIASYIRYHHERIDGFGYPIGLKDKQIPLGARIIAVVQTFLAKINGRKGRNPMLFDQALDVLRSASGTQLDAEVVDALIKWYQDKRSSSIRSSQSLGPCWEMRCSPVSICISCPAYKKLDQNCWDFESNNCLAHGNSCDTCFIKTEFMKRKMQQR